jgi:nicotinamidase/pyrazinamidase
MKALLLVDIQNDFLPGGALAVKEGDQIIPLINKLLEQNFDVIVATKDWHPADHGSFAAVHNKKPGDIINLYGLEQILWPVHCVQGSRGAEFSSKWNSSKVGKVFYKGTDKNIDSYSTFFDNGHLKSTELDTYLKEKKITDIYIAGLATDYCVKYSVLDAAELGYHSFVIADACRGVNLRPGDSERAIDEMRHAGATIINTHDVLKMLS